MTRSMTLPVSIYSATELALWSWFVFGTVVIALIPQARGMQQSIGWLPFWLIVAPLLDLAFIHRARLLSTSRALLVKVDLARARRRQRPARQAQRLRHRRIATFGAVPPRMATLRG
ncbi:MAG: hypothetical protein ABJB01_07015 [Rudaea sp.]